MLVCVCVCARACKVLIRQERIKLCSSHSLNNLLVQYTDSIVFDFDFVCAMSGPSWIPSGFGRSVVSAKMWYMCCFALCVCNVVFDPVRWKCIGFSYVSAMTHPSGLACALGLIVVRCLCDVIINHAC